MSTRIEICNAALARIAAEALQSEDAPGADQVLRLYDDTIRFLIGLKRWRFATRTVLLSRLAEAPASGFWLHQHKLPNDRIGLPDALFDKSRADSGVAGGRPFTDYELGEDVVLTDAVTIYCRYRFIPTVPMWPALFRECAIVLLASHCAATINEDNGVRDELRQEVLGDPRVPGALGLVGKASSFDAQSSPSRIVDGGGGVLIDVRRAGR